MANISETITQDAEFLAVVDLFDEEVIPQIDKLMFLADAVNNKALEDGDFINSSRGFYYIYLR